MKIARMLCCVLMGSLIGGCSAEPWQKIVMFILYFAYGFLNAIEDW